MTEGDGATVLAEYPGDEARVELLELGGRHGLEERELRPSGYERDDVEQPPGLGPEWCGSGEHRVTSRLRQGRGAEREDLGDEERIARSQRVDRVPVGALRPGEPAHGLDREPWHRQS